MNSQFRKASMALALSLMAMSASAQKTVTGKVKDASGEPLIGVSVMVDGTTVGGVTDFDGNFTIQNVPDNATLKLTYVGYLEEKLKVGNRTNVDVTMKEDNQQLDELVVVGYGVMKKRDLTGSVASVKSEDIANIAAVDAMSAMQAKVPGVDIQTSSGEAGSGISINVRGTRSILAGNGPLILVDGVEYGSNIDINPGDIESMDVLKDASSTAIYGSKGANGVVIITTKRGKAGKTKVNFNMYNSFNSVVNPVEMMYGDQEVQRLIDKSNYQTYYQTGTLGTATAADVLTESLSDGTATYSIYQDKSYTNWLDLLLQNSTTQNYELSVSGGNDKTNFSLSLGAMVDRGLMKNDRMTRYNGKVNLDHKISKYFKAGGSLLFTHKNRDRRNSGVYNQALKMTTITHPYLEDGSINATPNPWYAAHCSPLLDDVEGAYQNNILSTRFFGNVYLEAAPIKGLTLKTLFNIDNSNSRQGIYQDYESQSRYQSPSTSYIRQYKEQNTKYVWDNTANYNTDFNGSKHDLTVLVGNEVTKEIEETSNIYGDAGQTHYYESSFYDLDKISTATYESTYVKQSMISFFARANYSYDGKYLFSATIRTDGASQLADGHKWATFPSFSGAWRITEEKFMESTKNWLSNLKLRLAWGVSGNASIDPYETLGSLSSTTYYYNLAGNDVAGVIPSNMRNEELTWERTSQFNLGLDFGFFDGRINGGVDFYWSRTKDLLFYQTAPASSVFTEVTSNVGKTKGSGVELSLSTHIVKTKNFNFNIDWSYTHSTDEITELAAGVDRLITSDNQIYQVGERINSYISYETTGCWGVGEFDEELARYAAEGIETNFASGYGTPGTLKITDTNNDGQITDDDRIIYNMDASDILGATLSFQYKDWTLSTQLYARLGGYMQYDLNSQLNYESANWGNLDYWTIDNQSAKFPSPGLTSDLTWTYSTYSEALLYEKSNYFKIKDITLSYNFPKSILDKTKLLSRVRVYGSLKNFFSWCSVDNYDAERGGSINFPMRKQVVLGVNIEF